MKLEVSVVSLEDPQDLQEEPLPCVRLDGSAGEGESRDGGETDSESGRAGEGEGAGEEDDSSSRGRMYSSRSEGA